MSRMILICTMFLVACSNGPIETTTLSTANVPAAVSVAADEELTFVDDVLPILTQHECMLCHANFSDEAAVKTQSGAIIHRVKAGSMPLAREALSAEEIGVIERWRAQALPATVAMRLEVSLLERLVMPGSRLIYVMSYGDRQTSGEVDLALAFQDIELPFLEAMVSRRFRLIIRQGTTDVAEVTLEDVELRPGLNRIAAPLYPSEGSFPRKP